MGGGGLRTHAHTRAQAHGHRQVVYTHTHIYIYIYPQMAAFMKDMLRDVERERLTIDKCLRCVRGWVSMGVVVLGWMEENGIQPTDQPLNLPKWHININNNNNDDDEQGHGGPRGGVPLGARHHLQRAGPVYTHIYTYIYIIYICIYMYRAVCLLWSSTRVFVLF